MRRRGACPVPTAPHRLHIGHPCMPNPRPPACSLRDWKQLELFEREAATLQSLSHRGIPRYLRYFEEDTAADRAFFLVQASPGVLPRATVRGWVEWLGRSAGGGRGGKCAFCLQLDWARQPGCGGEPGIWRSLLKLPTSIPFPPPHPLCLVVGASPGAVTGRDGGRGVAGR